jgi:hypothetical protein
MITIMLVLVAALSTGATLVGALGMAGLVSTFHSG